MVKEKATSDEIQVEKKTLPLPFPQRHQKHQEEARYKKFMDLLKKVYINLSFVDILQSMPNY